jgi:hypothetical protein
MDKLSDWWSKVRWNWRRKDMHAPIHKWEVEKYLRDNNISHLEFYNEVAHKIRKQR